MKMNIKFNLSVVTTKIKDKQEKIKNLQPVMKEIAEDMKKETALNFRNTTSPEGKKWEALADSTIRQRRKNSQKPLNDTGVLKNSISAKSDETKAIVGTSVPYARIHQFGGWIEKKASTKTMYWKHNKSTGSLRMSKKDKSNFASEHKVKSHKFYIPARPYLGITDTMMDKYRGKILKYIK